MGQPVKDGPQCLFGVKLLWLKKLFKELFVEHGGDYVIHNYSDKTEKKLLDVRKRYFPQCRLRNWQISILYYMNADQSHYVQSKANG